MEREIEEAADIPNIPGMTKKNGKLYFNGEEVVGITAVGGDKMPLGSSAPAKAPSSHRRPPAAVRQKGSEYSGTNGSAKTVYAAHAAKRQQLEKNIKELYLESKKITIDIRRNLKAVGKILEETPL